jgi:hypothetical protein
VREVASSNLAVPTIFPSIFQRIEFETMTSTIGFCEGQPNVQGQIPQCIQTLIGRNLKQGDGFGSKELAECEKRLKLKLPSAFREHCEFAGKLPINTEDNILYGPKGAENLEGQGIVHGGKSARGVLGFGCATRKSSRPASLSGQ